MQPPDSAPTSLGGDVDPDPVQRCAVHPGRPARDRCPVCARPRCAADVEADATACTMCEGRPPGPSRRPPVDAAALAGAAVGCHLVAVVAAFVGQQYVEVRWFSLLVPAGVGILCALAAERGAGRARGTSLRVVAAVYAVLSTALAFVLEGSVDIVSPLGTVGPPYLFAAAGAWLWTQPPKRRPPAPGAEDVA